MAHLTIEIDGKYVTTLELQSALDLGRSSDCALSLPISFLSRRHLRLHETSEGWRVVDLGSTNGTWVGGWRITDHLLQEGEVIQLGSLALTFHERSPLLKGNSPVGDDGHPEAQMIANGQSLDDDQIAEILARRGDDSIDEDPAELAENAIEQQFEPSGASVAPALKHISPSVPARSEKVQSPSLWEIAMKPTPASPAQTTIRENSRKLSTESAAEQRQSGNPSIHERWKAVLERFDTDLKFKGGATLAIIVLFAVGGFYWLQANGFARPNESRINPATLNSQAQAVSPANRAKALRDLPV